VRKFGKFGESSLIHQNKTIQISTYNYNLCLNLFIHQTFLPNAQNNVIHQIFTLPNFPTIQYFNVRPLFYMYKLFTQTCIRAYHQSWAAILVKSDDLIYHMNFHDVKNCLIIKLYFVNTSNSFHCHWLHCYFLKLVM